MADLRMTRNVEFPGTSRIARARSLPDLGSRRLFFSGGSALNEIARVLKLHARNSIHLITPFDSDSSLVVLPGSDGMIRETWEIMGRICASLVS